MRQLYKSHRHIGYEIARTKDESGREFTILETAPGEFVTVLSNRLMPIGRGEANFELRIMIAQLYARCLFLQVSQQDVFGMMIAEMENEDIPTESEMRLLQNKLEAVKSEFRDGKAQD